MEDKSDFSKDKVSIEEAVTRAGFGLYSYCMMALAGCIVIAFAFIGYGNPIIVPTSACELQTTASQQGLLAAAPVVGTVLGTVVWGYLADTRGRRPMLIVALLGGAVMNSLASLSINWIMMMVLQFVAALFISGLHSMAMSILSESVPIAKRNLVVILVTSIFLLSQGLMAVLAIPIIPLTFSHHMPAFGIYWNSWRTLMLVYSLPALLSAIGVYFIQESPKFVYSKGDDERTLEILRVIHRVNCGKMEELNVTSILRKESTPAEGEAKKSQITSMFKPPLVKYTVIMSVLLVFQQIGAFIIWLPKIADQFVRIMDTGEGSDQNLCGIIASSIDKPAEQSCVLRVSSLLFVLGVAAMLSIVNLCFSLIVNRAGRRNLVLVITSTCGIAGILVNLVPSAAGSAALFAVQMNGIVVLGMYTAIIVALFPTHLRALALALPFTAGRIATFAAIQVLNIMLINNCEAGFYVFASIYTSSAIVASFLPDDRKFTPVVAKEVSIEESALRDTPKDLPAYKNLNE